MYVQSAFIQGPCGCLMQMSVDSHEMAIGFILKVNSETEYVRRSNKTRSRTASQLRKCFPWQPFYISSFDILKEHGYKMRVTCTKF
jgi:hypothetical protein